MISCAYGNEGMSHARCFEWHAHFKRGRTSLEDKRSGRTSTSPAPKNVETIRWLVHEDRRRTNKDIAAIVNVSYGTEQTIHTYDLNMHRVAAEFVPRLLTPKRKSTMLQFVMSFISASWMTHPSCQGSSLGMRVGSTGMIPRLNNSLCNGRAQDPQDRRRRGRAAVRPRACSCCFIRGIVHHEFAPEGQTVNTGFYCSVLRHLREEIWQKRPELWRAGAPSHRALVTREFLAHNSIITLPHLPYSPDLAPCDFFFFPKMKLQLKGRRFDRVEEIQWESQNVLGTLQEQDFQHTFQQWQRR